MIHRRDAQDAEETGRQALAMAVGCPQEKTVGTCVESGVGVRESGKPPLLNPEPRTLNPLHSRPYPDSYRRWARRLTGEVR